MSRMLRVAIGAVVTIAVAAAAVLIGVHFAATPEVKTQTVPVLAPLTVNGERPASTPGDGRLSPVVGETTVVTPGQKNASPVGAQVQAQIDALDARDGIDPSDTPRATPRGGSDPAVPADDPCSPASGTPAPASDCPDGLHGAIFADSHYGALTMALKASPPHGRSDSVFDCVQPTLHSGELLFDVMTNIPADVTLNYWPLDGTRTEQTVLIHGAAADVTAWNAYYRAHGNTYNYNNFTFQHCVTLTGIHPNTAYVGSAVALDTFGRTSDPVLANFGSTTAPTVPTMSAIPLTNSVLYTSVPFAQGGQQPVVKAWVVPSGARADCSSYDQTQQELQAVQTEGVYQVSDSYLRENNYLSTWNQRVVDIWEAPEGSTIVVCARTFTSNAPSWDRTRPTTQQFVRLDSPDTAVPVVTVKRLHLDKSVNADDIGISGTTQFGLLCGGPHLSSMGLPSDGSASAGSTVTVNKVLCDTSRLGDFGTASVGATDNIVVTTTSHLGTANYVNRATLPLSRYTCLGACPTLPPTLEYSVPLASPTPYRPITSCSDPSGCSYPANTNSTGSADLEVTWVRGNTNGRSTWSVGAVDPTLTPTPAASTPQLDQSVLPTVSLLPDGLSALADIPIRVDRHVHYRLSLSGDCFAAGAPRDYTGQTGLVGVGATIQTARQTVTGLCPNTAYTATIALTDDSGHFSTYSAAAATDAAHQWSGGYLRTPFENIRIDATITLTSRASAYYAWGSFGVDLSANSVASSYATPFSSACFPASTSVEGITGMTKTVTIPLASTIHISALSTAITEGLYHGVNHDANCSWTDQHWYEQTIVTDLSYADLSRGVTLTNVPTTEQPFTLAMHLRATNLGLAH